MPSRWRWGALGILPLAAGCATAPAPATAVAAGARVVAPDLRGRDQSLGNGLTLPAAPRIFLLESPRTFRFVPPDVLVHGVTSEDIASADVTSAEELRAAVVTILNSEEWTEVGAQDSAEYDIAVFFTARTEQVSETRSEPVSTATSSLPRCDESRGQRPGATCTNTPVRERTYRTSRAQTVRNVYHVIRRNDDGALKWWRHSTNQLDRVEALVARDLLRMLHSRR